MTASPRKAIRRMSEKRLRALGGRVFSTVSKRSSLPRRSAPKKKRRSKSERLRIYGPPGFIEWCHEQPCIACGVVGFSEVAHIKTGGTGRKADWTLTIPLCGTREKRVAPQIYKYRGGCHHQLHNIGRPNFEADHAFNLDTCAAEIQAAWLAHTEEGERGT